MENGARTLHTANEWLHSPINCRCKQEGMLHGEKWISGANQPISTVMRKVPGRKETAAKHVAFEL